MGFLEDERKRKLGIVDPPRGGAGAMELPEPRISPTQWFKFVMTHQAMLFPAFNMQRILQKRILGVSFWDKQTKRRKQMNEVYAKKWVACGISLDDHAENEWRALREFFDDLADANAQAQRAEGNIFGVKRRKASPVAGRASLAKAAKRRIKPKRSSHAKEVAKALWSKGGGHGIADLLEQQLGVDGGGRGGDNRGGDEAPDLNFVGYEEEDVVYEEEAYDAAEEYVKRKGATPYY